MNLNVEPTEEGRELAADLVNAECERKGVSGNWIATDFATGGNLCPALARLATRFLTMEADMAEIDRVTHPMGGKYVAQIRTITAKYRKPKPDPLVEAMTSACEKQGLGTNHTPKELAANLRVELAKRGIELKERGE